MTAQQESQNKRIAWISTAALAACLLLLMFFLVIFSPGNPPVFGGGGIELNFGLDAAGYGDVQPTEPVGDNNSAAEDAPAQSDEQSAPQQEVTPLQNTEVTKDQDEPLEDVKSQEESPVSVTPTKKEPVKEPVKTKDVPKTETPVKKEEPKVNQTTVYDPNAKKSSTQSAGEGKKGTEGNHGDQPGTRGDQGNPQGTLDADALYGDPGKGGGKGGGTAGIGLEMTGWNWDSPPSKPALQDNESGFVIFEVTIDDQGEIKNIKKVEGTLSPDAVKRCEAKIRERSFVRTAGGTIPQESKGRVRFNLVVR